MGNAFLDLQYLAEIANWFVYASTVLPAIARDKNPVEKNIREGATRLGNQ
ncbi:hypothetical protein G7076_02920 [Sphingomonas sp. HDW15A]|nr:hypothetical protein [Sphingomonas sp. HDW15A]QIK95569.1 hypothetical protein G7076_02920 [Sphingomonas sp. HDW15A]